MEKPSNVPDVLNRSLTRREFLQGAAAIAAGILAPPLSSTESFAQAPQEEAEPGQLDYPVTEYGIGAPLSLEQLHEILQEINEDREHTPIQDTLYVAYGANAASYEQLGVNFGYESTQDFIKYHLHTLEEMMYQAGMRSVTNNRLQIRLDSFFVLQDDVALPASHDRSYGLPNRELDTIRGVYVSLGNPNIDPNYLGPDDTAQEIQDANGNLIDLSLLHEVGHFFGFGHPENKNVDLKIGTSMIPQFPDHWQRFVYARKYETEGREGTLMTGGGNTILDPEYAWLMNFFIKNGYTREGTETYRGIQELYIKNADSIELVMGEKFNTDRVEVTRTFHLPPVDLAAAPAPIVQTLEGIQEQWNGYVSPDQTQAFYAAQTINGTDYVFMGYQADGISQITSVFETQIPVAVMQANEIIETSPLSAHEDLAQGDASNGFLLVARQPVQEGKVTIGNPFGQQEGWIYPADSTVLIKIHRGNQNIAMRWLDTSDFLPSQPPEKTLRASKIRLTFGVVESPGSITAEDFDWTVKQENLEIVRVQQHTLLPLIPNQK